MNYAPNINVSATELLANYFDKRIAGFFKYFQETKEDFGVHSLHQMRVEVKKLRALLRMLEMATANSFQKADYFKLLAKIFKPGGRLRETQINLSLIEKYTSYQLPEYYLHLRQLEAKQTEKLKVALNKVETVQFDNLNTLVRPFLETIEINELEQELSGFISQELDTINTLRPGIYNDKELHKLRMHLKAMGYMTKLLNEIKPDQMPCCV